MIVLTILSGVASLVLIINMPKIICGMTWGALNAWNNYSILTRDLASAYKSACILLSFAVALLWVFLLIGCCVAQSRATTNRNLQYQINNLKSKSETINVHPTVDSSQDKRIRELEDKLKAHERAMILAELERKEPGKMDKDEFESIIKKYTE